MPIVAFELKIKPVGIPQCKGRQHRLFPHVTFQLLQMSELEARFVKRGMWVNHSKGALLGRVITTDIQSGTLVIALLAVLSAIGNNASLLIELLFT